MNWYEICKHRYPKNYMTVAQLDRILGLGLITQIEYDEIIAL